MKNILPSRKENRLTKIIFGCIAVLMLVMICCSGAIAAGEIATEEMNQLHQSQAYDAVLHDENAHLTNVSALPSAPELPNVPEDNLSMDEDILPMGVNTIATISESNNDEDMLSSPLLGAEKQNVVVEIVWTNTATLPRSSGNYKLTQNIQVSTSWSAPRGITNLDLNGYTISLVNGYGPVMYVRDGSTLNLYDSRGVGKITGGDKSQYNGGGVYVYDGEFTMNGGTITKNTANYGGGVFVYDGVFTMNGGTITDNTASYGGGVCVYGDGLFTMNGGTITDNTGTRGGGVCVYNGSFTLNDGTISKNIDSSYGGGVYVYGGAFTMLDGIISSNKAWSDGGGVHVGDSSQFTYIDGVIAENHASFGGGVYVCSDSEFLMNGGSISYNYAYTNSGGVGVDYDSRFFMNGGLINGNDALYIMGGVGNSGTFVMSKDATIDEDNCVYLSEGTSLVISGTDFTGSVKNITGRAVSLGYGLIRTTDGLTASDIIDNVALSNSDFKLLPYDDTTIIITFVEAPYVPSRLGYYQLTNDIVLSEGLVVSDKLDLDLNGHTLSVADGVDDSVILVYGENAVLKLYDNSSNKSGIITGSNMSGISVSDGTLQMYGGNITGNVAQGIDGGGVYLWNGKFMMFDGNISYNSANLSRGFWDGVYWDVESGEKSINYGGGVYMTYSSLFEMFGGTITCNAAYRGGGVYVNDGSFYLYNGNITRNLALDEGGGVYASFNTLVTMYDGNIQRNVAEMRGGGLHIDGSEFTMDGGSVVFNEALVGGGIFADVAYLNNLPIYGYAVINGGNISSNWALVGGGIGILNSYIDLNGGNITNNVVVNNGGGVYVESSVFTMKGGNITGNIMGDTDLGINGNLLLEKSVIIIDDDGLKDNTRIGVGTFQSPTENVPVAITGKNNADYSHYFFADNSSQCIENIDNVLYIARLDIEEIVNTTESVNAATTAEMEYHVSSSHVNDVRVPTLTRNGKSVPLDDAVTVLKVVGGVEINLPATVNVDGTITVTGDVSDADLISISFIGRKIGDVSGDGSPNTLDAAMILKASAEIEALDVKGDFYGDVTNDGQTTTLDAARILQHSADMTDDDYELIG